MTEQPEVAPRRFFQSAERVPKKLKREVLAKGIRRRLSGGGILEARVQAGGREHNRCFPPGTSLETIALWQKHMVESLGNARLNYLRPCDRPVLPSVKGWCYVYFVRQGQCIKVGRAVDVARRLEELQTASSLRLELLVAFGAHASLETELLKRLEPFNTGGEWFLYGPEIERLVVALRQGVNPVELLFEWDHISGARGEQGMGRTT